MNLMEDFYHHNKFVKGFNPSFIVLIPKKEEALELSDHIPISLIGALYKIISKVLSIRLSKVMGQ